MTDRRTRRGRRSTAGTRTNGPAPHHRSNARTAEHLRLDEAARGEVAWKRWGPYLSERQWGTVREDYSPAGDAWNYLSHDQSRSRVYRWGEDGLAGVSDESQYLCFALALWNGADAILKERLFGLTNGEGNHGEDVKEYYFYLDSTPTHSYMKYLYKYPQRPFPYQALVDGNRRSRAELEYELLDTRIFDEDRYFDVFVEYAKAASDDLLIRVSAFNRGPEPAELCLLPTLWFRNTWSWAPAQPRPLLSLEERGDVSVVLASHAGIGDYHLYCQRPDEVLFVENETNRERLFGEPNHASFVKDGINRYLVEGNAATVNPEHTGTKAAAVYRRMVEPGQAAVCQLRLTTASDLVDPFDKSGPLIDRRRREADQFYDAITPVAATEDERTVMRQALAGLLWSKQAYFYDVGRWGAGDASAARRAARADGSRNGQWRHVIAQDVISMPDKWEYPWFAVWDLALQAVPLAMVDPDFAKAQLELMTETRYMHPNGQLPAYEWNFSDVNPPVHAWATWRVYLNEKQAQGVGDLQFLKRIFHKLLMNFTWWVNRKDVDGRNVFDGGFLGLDNIGVFDRSAPLPTGGHLEQADGTAWMALYCLEMLTIALELAQHDDAYEEAACKFYEQFLFIADAMNRIGVHDDELWDEQDGFFYDLLRLPSGEVVRLKVRSLVGLISLCAIAIFTPGMAARLPNVLARVAWYQRERPDLTRDFRDARRTGVDGRRLFSILSEDELRRVLSRMLDESEFLSPHGIRSLSRFHKDNPFVFWLRDQAYRVDYEPAESSTGLFGGNSNWRGPIWMPINALLVEALLRLYRYFGDDFVIECPTGSGQEMTLYQVAEELSRRLSSIFLRDGQGLRPVYGGTEKFQHDPHWRDLVLFYEYFHGDNGAGMGASHQTGWTAAIARLIQFFRANPDANTFLQIDRGEAIRPVEFEPSRPAASARASTTVIP
jgi:Mannosylglycerate hydrolase MGH1-like glycoside hydrolase domain